MPTSFLSADAGFPRLTNDIPMEERMNRVQQYLYMLLEQLKYALANLSADNFNEADLAKLQEETTAGIRSVVTDLAGNVSSLEQTAESITSRINNVDGQGSTIEQTATRLNFAVFDPSGAVSQVTQTANGITTRLNDFDGSGSTIEQTARELNFAVFDLAGNVSLVSQKADRIDWIVASGTSISDMTMTPEAIDLFAQGINIEGYVTFSSLKTAGQSIINGDNIELKADADGDSVSYLTYTSVNGNTFAEIHTRDNQKGSTLSQDRYAFVIETPQQVDGGYVALKLVAGDAMSLEAAERIFVKADVQTIINNGTHATRIQANNVYYDPTSTLYPTDCYIFASDGIYYNGTRILST